jgi:hypothetical protein
MKCNLSARTVAGPLALLLGVAGVATTTVPKPAFGETTGPIWQQVGKDWKNANGTTMKVFVNWDNPDVYKFDVIDKAGKIYTVMMKQVPKSNPDPDAATSKGVEPVDVGGLIKKGLITYKVLISAENTQLARWIDREGGGIIPHYNPGDQDGGKGPSRAPKGPDTGPTAKQKGDLLKNINFIAKSLNTIGTSMGMGEEGGSESWSLDKSGSSKGRGNGSGKGDGNYKNAHIGGGEAVTLGPRPDLVNPAPKNRTGSSRPAAIRAPIRGGAPGANLR